MRVLWVGDPHIEAHDLEDAQRLVDFTDEVLVRERPDYLLVAGDLYNTHAIIHAEVMWFWREALRKWEGKVSQTLLMKGNHDAPGTENSHATALIAHEGQRNVTIVRDSPMLLDGCLIAPYTSGVQLINWSQQNKNSRLLFCHQTFDGSQYENGFYAGDGVDPDSIFQGQIISGHIHAPQEFGTVWYPGAPRHRVSSDANSGRAIWMLDIQDGKLTSRTPYDTGTACRRIHHFVDSETTPAQPTVMNTKDEYRVDIVGSRAYIEARKPLFAGYRIRTSPTDTRTVVAVRESEGVGKAFQKYLNAYQPKHGTDKETLGKMVAERLPNAW